jgi:hypothetical protein
MNKETANKVLPKILVEQFTDWIYRSNSEKPMEQFDVLNVKHSLNNFRHICRRE